MEADYDGLIEKKQLPALGMMRQAEPKRKNCWRSIPTAQDAYMALGASNYIIGCLPGYKRAFLWFGGVHGDRERGMEQMQMRRRTRPLPAAVRENPAGAGLRARASDGTRPPAPHRTRGRIPSNPLFAHELALLDRSRRRREASERVSLRDDGYHFTRTR